MHAHRTSMGGGCCKEGPPGSFFSASFFTSSSFRAMGCMHLEGFCSAGLPSCTQMRRALWHIVHSVGLAAESVTLPRLDETIYQPLSLALIKLPVGCCVFCLAARQLAPRLSDYTLHGLNYFGGFGGCQMEAWCRSGKDRLSHLRVLHVLPVLSALPLVGGPHQHTRSEGSGLAAWGKKTMVKRWRRGLEKVQVGC